MISIGRQAAPALPLADGPRRVLPKAPVLGWRSLCGAAAPELPSVADLPWHAYTTSGRAALYLALRQMRLPSNTPVLVPTYHCPTMIAPVVAAGLTPRFYGLAPDGSPRLEGMTEGAGGRARVVIVAQLFGLPRSLAAEADWCRREGVALIEDCAHSFFGQAGERPVGAWGDYATASLSKFYPVPEGGILASATRDLSQLGLAPQTLRAELKTMWDIVDRSRSHGRLRGLAPLLAPADWLRRLRRRPPASGADADLDGDGDAARDALPSTPATAAPCDMSRVDCQASWAARAIHRRLAAGTIVARRQAHFRHYAASLGVLSGACILQPAPAAGSAPYVVPLWVAGTARADAVYAQLRAAGTPVLRWDRLWPGTPADPADTGTAWSRQLLQLLCHQDLTAEDVEHAAGQVRAALQVAARVAR